MLSKFKLVNTDGLKGLTIKGDFVPFDKLTDDLAEQLMGKTHVLERVGEAPTTAVAVASGEPAGEPSGPKKAKS